MPIDKASRVYVVPYAGSGLYQPEDIGIRFDDLGYDNDYDDTLPLPDDGKGWWPVAQVELPGVWTEPPFTTPEGVTINNILVVCVYQLTFQTPVAWRVPVRASRSRM